MFLGGEKRSIFLGKNGTHNVENQKHVCGFSGKFNFAIFFFVGSR
jgi:hypothetical protein